jgi:competence protein ComGC
MFLEGVFLMIVLIVAITTIGDVVKKRYESQSGGATQEDLARIQADLNELKKRVTEIHEYVTDLYIQQNDENLR